MPIRARLLFRSVVLIGALLAAGLAGAPATAAPPDQITFDGRGWGHGRGMGQWGAYGYAVDRNWTGTMILDRFYAGTHTSTTATNPRQRVGLLGRTGQELIVYNQLGRLRVSSDHYAGYRYAFRVQRVDNPRFRVFTGSTCSGPWREWGTLKTVAEIRIKPAANNNDPRAMLQRCGSTGTRYYRGDLLAVHDGGTMQTVNDVDTENLVRSVIAREVSPSWYDAGGGRGARAVRAQAVAARSYVEAGDGRFAPWATTCDTTQCQLYQGYGTRNTGSATITKVEDPRTDAAVEQTPRQVRRHPNGMIARTEFSSSTGGWTAGITFPVRPDDGDQTAANPNHTWSATVARTTIEARFDARQGTDVGTYEGIDILDRNGYGVFGGRVLSMRVRFTGVDVTLTGDEARYVLGLKSNWFAVT